MLTARRQPLEGGSDGSAHEMTHHTAPSGPKVARVGEEVVHDAHEA